MRIAMVGTRGIPAAYSGFETAVEALAARFAGHGHEVTVYCRRHMVENVRTDLIAAEAASSRRASFFLSMTVPKAMGTTGTFVNIEAIR